MKVQGTQVLILVRKLKDTNPEAVALDINLEEGIAFPQVRFAWGRPRLKEQYSKTRSVECCRTDRWSHVVGVKGHRKMRWVSKHFQLG